MADLGSNCVHSAVTCGLVAGANVDDDGTATLFWYQESPSAAPGLHAATNVPGGTTLQSSTLVSASTEPGMQPVALGGHRFAVVAHSSPNWTSTWVDFSTATPSVSTPVALPLTDTAQIVSSTDGVYALGPDVVNGDISLGSGSVAKGVNVQLPNGLDGFWFGAFAPANTGTPSVWWAFIASQANAPLNGPGAYLTRVSVPNGAMQPAQLKSTGGVSGGSNCQLPSNPVLAGYGMGQAVVGWVDYNATKAGCDVLVDGSALSDNSNGASSLPVLGGSQSGAIAVWMERDLTGTAGYTFRLVWRQRNDVTGAWSDTQSLSSKPLVELNGAATTRSGAVVIAWDECNASGGASSCTSYVSKYTGSSWSTQPFAQGLLTSPQLAINASGQAIVAWEDDDHAKIYAYRF